jgi:hypothetical protein
MEELEGNDYVKRNEMKGKCSIHGENIHRFKTFMVVNIRIVVLWVMTPCSLMGGYQHFGGTYYKCQQLLKAAGR